MSTKKSGKSEQKSGSGKARRELFPLKPFFLPGDMEPPPEKPCSVEDLLTTVAGHLNSVASPDFGDIKLTEEQRINERISWANAAMRELWNWLAAHAVAGNAAAQDQVFKSALGITDSFIACARQKLPGIVERAKKANLMPGYVSVDLCCQDAMQKLCREIGQGSQFPFPFVPPGVKSKKRKGKLSTAQHDLVNRLFGYIEEYRLLRQWNPLCTSEEIEKQKERGYFVSPLLVAMLNLPPLAPETWREWRDVGRRVIEDHTGGNPAQHSAFHAGGFFASLGLPASTAKRQEITLWKRLDEAWKLRAESMVALPVNSFHHKDYSRP